MRVTALGPADYKRMPWKNGGGSTLELLQDALPAGGFNWRLSIADVASAGPFSTFEGIDRQIMLVNGNGMVLSFGQEAPPVVLSKPLKPHGFKGEWATDCRLIDGVIQDFNVMVRRTWGSAAVNGFDLVKDQRFTLAVAPLVILHLLSGVVDAAGTNMRDGDTLRLDSTAPELVTVQPQSPNARLIVVSLKAH
ncbi:HutD/Ves family protein [Dongia rigui]|uniref:HutD family protein n=1 Tax=Dongia rigui TaxID=940149 RepID=A0ABU5DSR9_9PROT|nr:HutD family protein [Dongia rigui]MDY0870429.1 HutD family protein [Dongia rigui]